MKPSLNESEFHIRFDKNWYKKDDILNIPSGAQCIVVKVYNSWWRRWLFKIGIRRFLKLDVVKVKTLYV